MDKDRYDLLSSLHESVHVSAVHEYPDLQQPAGSDHSNFLCFRDTCSYPGVVQEQPDALLHGVQLIHPELPVQEAPDESAARRVEVRQAAPEQRQDMSKYRENKENLSDPNQQAAASQDTREQQKREPIRAEKTVGRNDPCPCGSGKKYKNCHGKNL